MRITEKVLRGRLDAINGERPFLSLYMAYGQYGINTLDGSRRLFGLGTAREVHAFLCGVQTGMQIMRERSLP
jgi:hypothetical protein